MAKNNLIVKSNQVVEASYTLTTTEQRLILSAIAQVPKGEEVSDDVLYPLATEDLIKLGGDEKASHKEFKDAVNRLYERSIVLRDGNESDSFRWIQEKVFNGPSMAFVRFSKPILPFLSNLKAEFTKYLESDIVGMSSPYAIRIYELMMQYRSVGHREISLDDLRWMFQLENKYPVWADLKKRVIDQATKEINEHSPYKLTIEPKRTGRKITSIALKFQNKKALKAPKGKASSPNYGRIDERQKDPNTPDMFHGKTENEQRQGMSGIGSIAKPMPKKEDNALAHRVSRMIQKIQADPELQKRIKLPDETFLQMARRIREDVASDALADHFEAKLQR